MSKRFLSVALFSLVLGMASPTRAEEAAKTPLAPSAECPHMKAMREAQEQGKEGGGCPHMKDGKPCDCPHHQAGKDSKEGGGCPHMKDGKEGGACPHMKDGKSCDCPNHKAASAPKSAKPDKPAKQPAKADKAAGKKAATASSATEAKGSKE
jgi:hypothetical protein